ncbi:MAG: hypothetical protein IKS49_01370 [Actinomycetaceae bacterium]|nr:hypothetical protein [Actinomycetaceae bacterium]
MQEYGFGADNSDFSSVLRTAVTASGMSLAQIVDKLAERNIKVTQAALSYWQSGRSLPRRQRSRQALVELEDIFSLPAGALTNPLQQELLSLSTGQSFSSPYPRASSAPNSGFNSDSIDWSNEVYREMISIRAMLSYDRQTLTEKVTTLIRVPNVDRPTFHVGYHWAQLTRSNNGTTPQLSDVEGAIVGDSLPFENSTHVTCLYLPDFIRPGDLHQISYTTVSKSDKPIECTTERWFAWPLRYYTVFLDFGGNEPNNIEWVQAYTQESDGLTQRIEKIRPLSPLNSTIQIAASNIDGGSSVIRWQW